MSQSVDFADISTGESPAPAAAAQPQAVPLTVPFAQQTVLTGLPRMMQPAVSLQHSHGLLQELTQDLTSDTTKPSTVNVKVSQPLTKDGYNLRPWLYDFVNCAIAKECIEALQKPMPRTRANSAAIHLLISSTPSEFSWYLASCGTAYAALQWIISKYEGGHDRSINNEWFRRLAEEGMTRE